MEVACAKFNVFLDKFFMPITLNPGDVLGSSLKVLRFSSIFIIADLSVFKASVSPRKASIFWSCSFLFEPFLPAK